MSKIPGLTALTKLSKLPRLTKLTDIFRDPVYVQVILTTVLIIVSLIVVFAITAAWYTNIISTDSLEFRSSEWGFTGNVDITSELVEAYPGSSATVPFSVTNPTEQTIAVSVDISKTQMSTDIKQRIYFYVDDTRTINGETVERTYINSLSNYQYILFPNQNLDISEEMNNFAPVKWEWTFDVLGFYFSGTVTPSSTIVDEYLIPVTYDYDAATFDGNGKLLTTNGTQTVTEFLAQISAADGFAGTVNPAAAVSECYPVEVDATGNGVWLYLCNYGEIELANETDTALGDAAAAGTDTAQFTAAMSIVGQQKKYETVEISSTQELNQALSDPDCELISLPNDLAIDSMITVPEGTEKVIDCNGNTIETVIAGDIFKVENSSLTIIDGNLQGGGTNSYAVSVTNGDVHLNNVTITDVERALNIKDNLGTGPDSSIHLSNCNITTDDVSVFICGNGVATSRDTRLIIDNSVINSTGYVGIFGNGSEGVFGTDVQIRNSEIFGYWGGIYQPQRIAKLAISDSTVSGYTGMAIKGGTVIINNSTVSGTDTTSGSVSPSAPALMGSGYSDTGDGLYVETNYNYPIDITITGEDTVISGFSGYAVRQHESTASSAKILISGGSYNSDVSAFLAENCVCTYTNGRYVVNQN